ncbi:MAG: AEC family transporter [Methanotrichaceae archaeon]|nr:AEC family transporter [Methanotrichaceae archaeon]
MSPIEFSVIRSLAVIGGLVLLGLALRRRAIISVGDRPLLSRLVTDVAVPAMILLQLSRQGMGAANLLALGAMLASLLILLVLSWAIGRLLKLSRPQMGSFILVSSFGNAATLGYALVLQTFPNDPRLLSEAALVAGLGSAVPAFVLGMAIAIYYGKGEGGSLRGDLMEIISSPITASLILALIVNWIHPSLEGPLADVLIRLLQVIEDSLTLLVTLAIALMLRPISLRLLGISSLAVIALKLIANPLLTLFFGLNEVLPVEDIEVLMMLAAMPSGAIVALFADRYGCDGALASALVIITFIISLVTLPLVIMLA